MCVKYVINAKAPFKTKNVERDRFGHHSSPFYSINRMKGYQIRGRSQPKGNEMCRSIKRDILLTFCSQSLTSPFNPSCCRGFYLKKRDFGKTGCTNKHEHICYGLKANVHSFRLGEKLGTGFVSHPFKLLNKAKHFLVQLH